MLLRFLLQSERVEEQEASGKDGWMDRREGDRVVLRFQDEKERQKRQ